MLQDRHCRVSGFTFPVMPTKVGVHVFADRSKERRGWPAFADHDG
jgi:hypothetical protein